jgi:hypothetical protein
MDWIRVAQGGAQLRDLVNTLTKIRAFTISLFLFGFASISIPNCC